MTGSYGDIKMPSNTGQRSISTEYEYKIDSFHSYPNELQMELMITFTTAGSRLIINS